MVTARRWQWCGSLLLLAVIAGGASWIAGDGGAAVERQAVSAPFDVDEAISRVRLAFRPEGGGRWSAGAEGHQVTVSADGFAIAPTLDAATALRVSPARISRGGRALDDRLLEVATAAPDRLDYRRGEYTELLTNRRDGFEQSWRFEQPPGGEGDLRLELAISGLPFAAITEGGAHFRDGEVGIRYGHGTWIDADGKRVDLRVAYENGALALTVPESVLRSSRFPAVLDPVISAESELDAPIPGQPAYGQQYTPQLAFDGANYLVVWSDYRAGGRRDVFGARVAPDGTVLDPTGIAISTGFEDEYDPAVAYAGNGVFLVAWEDFRSGSTVDIYGARVNSQGAVLDPSGLAVGAGSRQQLDPAVTSDGTSFLVLFRHESATSGVYDIGYRRVSAAGTLLDAAIGILTSTTVSKSDPAAGFDGVNYFAVWTEATDLYATLMAPSGTVLYPSGVLLVSAAGAQVSPNIAFSGTQFLVSFRDSRSGNQDVYSARVTTSSGVISVLDPAGFPVSSLPTYEGDPSSGFNGQHFVVAWTDQRDGGGGQTDIYAARVALDGSVQDPLGFAVNAGPLSHGAPSVGAHDGGLFLAYDGLGVAGASDVFGAQLAGDATVLTSELLLSKSANGQSGAVAAFDGTQYLVVWSDFRDIASGWDIYGRRFDQTGQPVGAAFPISTAADVQSAPAIAFDGSSFLVAWSDRRSGEYDVYGTLVSTLGAVSSPNGIAISSAAALQFRPTISFGAGGYLVAWTDSRNGTSDIFAARVSASGQVLDPNGFAVITAANTQDAPAAAFDGTNHLVVWHDYRTGAGDIYGARVSPSGAVLASPFAITPTTRAQTNPAVAFGAGRYLVVWSESSSTGYLDIQGARVAPSGTVLDSTPQLVNAAANDQLQPAVIFDGTNFAVVWGDYGNVSWNPPRHNLYGARFGPDAGLRDATRITVSAASENEQSPRLAAGLLKQLLVLYSRYDADAGVRAFRGRSRLALFNEAPDAGPMSFNTQEDTAAVTAVSAWDFDGDALVFTVVAPPTSGTLSGPGPGFTYTPAANFNGQDSFSFKASDGPTESNVVTATITVAAVNDAPVCAPASATVLEDSFVALTLTATDVEGDAVSYSVVGLPANGALSGTAPSLSYAPSANFNGQDTFTFKANDGQADSALQTATLTVTPVNDAPLAAAQTVSAAEDTPVAVALAATDVDGDALSYLIVSQPARGTLSGTPPNLTYTPGAELSGADTFSFKANDGTVDSNTATVTVNVAPVADAPVAISQTVSVFGPTLLTLAGTDADGDPLSYAVVAAPTSGALSGSAPNLTYTPNAGFSGSDSFTFKVNDGALDSNVATVSLVVTAVNDGGASGVDAGSVDAGIVDAGTVDAGGSGDDAGSGGGAGGGAGGGGGGGGGDDAGSGGQGGGSGGGSDDPAETDVPVASGCGCAAPGGGFAWLPMGLVALALRRWRRREDGQAIRTRR